MQKLTLINTLRSFSPKEIREFGEFVHSPFFNKNQAAMKLYDHIKKYYPDFNSDKLNKETAYKILFAGSNYSESFMKTIIHILSNLSEKFLFQMNLIKKPSLEILMICDELNARKLEKQLFKTLKEADKEIDKVKDINESKYFYYRYLYYAIRLEYMEWTKFKNRNLVDYDSEAMQIMTDSLSSYYFEKLLAIYRNVMQWREIHPVKFDEKLADYILKFLLEQQNDFIKSPNLRIHLYELMLHKDASTKYYYILKDILKKESDNISADKKFSLNTILQQYCLKKTTDGVKGFVEERLELYKLSLEKNFYKLRSHLYFDQISFGNIALTAIMLKEIEWAESFIEKYSSELPPDNDEIVLTYINARLQFSKGEFTSSLEMLNSIKTMIHVPYKVVIRNLMLMLYYELSYFEQGEYHLSSYKKFISANEMQFSAERLERQQNFLKYYSKLLKLKMQQTNDGIEEMIKILGTNSNIIEREWLHNKALALAKK